MSTQPVRSRALEGIRVIDLTTFLSGPFCTQLLADLGAEVVKVESHDGDSSRAIPPHFVGADSAYFLSVNRNKRSIAIDLKTPRGVELVRQLIAGADVVVENFRPGVCRATRSGSGGSSPRASGSGVGLDHRLRLRRAVEGPRGLRHDRPGRVRGDEPDR